jgi:hypothetical protein
MSKTNHPVEKLVETLTYKGVEFEVVERPDVIWVGCVDYAVNNIDESDIGATLKRYREELINVTKQDLIDPDWSAALSINYCCDEKPCGIMFAQETYSNKQDERYDLFTQPEGLWLRVKNDKSAAALLGKESAETHEYFSGERKILRAVAEANGYKQNPDILVEIEYHCHAEYGNPTHTNYAYIPICRK